MLKGTKKNCSQLGNDNWKGYCRIITTGQERLYLFNTDSGERLGQQVVLKRWSWTLESVKELSVSSMPTWYKSNKGPHGLDV
jgi:hypothetical protein